MTDDINDEDNLTEAQIEALERREAAEEQARLERQQAVKGPARLLFETSGNDLGDAIEALLGAADEYRSVVASTNELDDKAAEYITDLDACMAFNAVVFHFGGERLYELAEELIKAQDGD